MNVVIYSLSLEPLNVVEVPEKTLRSHSFISLVARPAPMPAWQCNPEAALLSSMDAYRVDLRIVPLRHMHVGSSEAAETFILMPTCPRQEEKIVHIDPAYLRGQRTDNMEAFHVGYTAGTADRTARNEKMLKEARAYYEALQREFGPTGVPQ